MTVIENPPKSRWFPPEPMPVPHFETLPDDPDEFLSGEENREIPYLSSERKQMLRATLGNIEEFIATEIGRVLPATIAMADRIAGIRKQLETSLATGKKSLSFLKPVLEKIQGLQDYCDFALSGARKVNSRGIERIRTLLDILGPESYNDVNCTPGDVWEQVGQIVKKERIELVSCSHKQPEASLRLDKNKMSRVVAELVDNAAQAVERKGQPQQRERGVKVFSGIADDQFTVSVVDNGTGMSQELMESLWHNHDSYCKSDFNQESFTGPVLGLYMGRALVEHYGGSLMFRTKKGIGSVFIMKIPLKSLQ